MIGKSTNNKQSLESSSPLTEEQLAVIMKDPFKIGTFFLKYRKIRDPAIRFVWISVEGDKLCWSKPGENHLRMAVRGSLRISEIQRIKDGLDRTWGLPKENKELRLACSFTVYASDKIIELEAPTEKVKKDWVDHLCTLVGN